MEKYISPVMDINEFETENVVTASGGSGCSPVDKVVTPGLDCGFGDSLCLDNTCNDTCGAWEAW